MVLPAAAPVPDDAFGTGGSGELASLGALLRLGRGRFTLAFACYDRPSQRGRLIGRLEAELAGWTLAAVSLQDPGLDPRERSGELFRTLKRLAEGEAAGRTLDGVLLLDWEKRLLPPPVDGERGSGSLAGLFNRGRHLLPSQFSCPVVVWLPWQAMATLENRAPDFVSWQSGAFYYPFDAAEVEAGLRAILAAESPAVRERAVAAIELLEGTLADWEELGTGDLPDDLLPRALSRLGQLHLDVGDPGRAAACFQRLSGWGKEHDALDWSRQARKEHRRAVRKAAHPELSHPDTDPWKVFRGAATLTEEIYGREADLEALLERVLTSSFRCGTLWGETGCGKTSLLVAGLRPALTRLGHLPVVVERYDEGEAGLCRQVAVAAGLAEPAEALSATLAAAQRHLGLAAKRRRIVLVLDQLERIFDRAVFPERRQRERFFESLAASVNDLTLPFACLLSIRADRLYHLFELDRHLPLYRPLAAENLLQLRWLGRRQALRVLTRLRQAAAAPWAPGLLDQVVADLARDDQVRPVELQLVAAALYLREVHTVSGYQRAGGKEGLLQDYLNAILDECPHPGLARKVLRALVDPGSPPVRRTLPLEEIARETGERERAILAVLESLAQRHVVQVAGEATWELVHDVLTEPALRAGSPQEVGLGLLRSALLRGRRWLPPRQLWRVLKSDRDELPESLRKPARKLMARSGILLALMVLLAGLLLLTGVQLSTAHVRIGSDPPQPLVVYRGLRGLSFLPPPLGRTPLYDTGIVAAEVEVGRHGEVLDTTLWAWEGARGQDVARMHKTLTALPEGQRLCFIGRWEEGIRRLLSPVERSERYVRIDSSMTRGILGLAAFNPDDVLRELQASLEDPDVEVQIGAIGALGQLPEERVAPLLPQLVALTSGSEPRVVAAALEVLSTADGSHAAALIPRAASWLQSPDFRLRRAAVRFLARSGQAEAVFAEASRLLDSPDRSAQTTALELLAGAGTSGKQAAALIPRLLGFVAEQGDLGEAAAEVLRQIPGPDLEPWAGRLEPLLAHPDGQITTSAALALASIGPRHADLAMPEIVTAIRLGIVREWPQRYRDYQTAPSMHEQLVEIGLAYPEVVIPSLLSMLRDSGATPAVAQILLRIGKAQSEVVVEPLRDLLPSANPFLQAQVIQMLGELAGEEAHDSLISQLLPFLDAPVPGVKAAAAEVLGRLAGDDEDGEVLTLLATLTRDPEIAVRSGAARALRHTPRDRAAELVPQLLPLLDDEDPFVYEAVMATLGEIGGGQASTIAPALLPHLDRHSIYGPYGAEDVIADLAEFELLPESVAEELEERLRKPGRTSEAVLRAMGAHWLHEARSQDERAVSALLLERLEGDESRLDARYRKATVYALAHWYNAGLPAQEEETPEPPWIDPRADAEHRALAQEIDRLRELERPWWLRVAAWEVLLTAEELRRPPSSG